MYIDNGFGLRRKRKKRGKRKSCVQLFNNFSMVKYNLRSLSDCNTVKILLVKFLINITTNIGVGILIIRHTHNFVIRLNISLLC